MAFRLHVVPPAFRRPRTEAKEQTAVTRVCGSRRGSSRIPDPGVEPGWPGTLTFAPGGRITVDQVKAELAHLRSAWTDRPSGQSATGLIDQVVASSIAEGLDRFERIQLEAS